MILVEVSKYCLMTFQLLNYICETTNCIRQYQMIFYIHKTSNCIWWYTRWYTVFNRYWTNRYRTVFGDILDDILYLLDIKQYLMIYQMTFCIHKISNCIWWYSRWYSVFTIYRTSRYWTSRYQTLFGDILDDILYLLDIELYLVIY